MLEGAGVRRARRRRACRPCARTRCGRRRAGSGPASGCTSRRRSGRSWSATRAARPRRSCSPSLSWSAGRIETRLALPQRSPMPFIVPCTSTAPSSHRGDRVRDAALGVVVGVDARPAPAPNSRRRRARSRRRPRDGRLEPFVSHSVTFSAPASSAASRHRSGVVGVVPVRRRRSARRRRSLACPARQVRHRVGDQLQVLLRVGVDHLLEVKLPGLPDQRADRREAIGQQRAAPGRLRPRRRAGASCRRRRSPPSRSAPRSSSSKSSASFGFELGKPASMKWMPSRSSACATRSFSSAERDIPSPCMPSRRVVS